ncbi:sensor histidine kinase [Haliangium ochraceum]|uniref:histidine kinase n=1 Tax=Haliangium ochraceum (strain DSM 14365 / JCM 11303 / SMP-2) TaxID=502025 RepID=D0LHB0_HALO1|nr:ATP-binding protein [Haliangium ochraceum]ACY18255.1 GAF sensor signal transduction histidine kinase [Haliangium ochraceum DSM 14365]
MSSAENLSLRSQESEAVIRTLYEITADYGRGFAHQMQRLLALGCRRFQLDIGILSRIVDDRYEVLHVFAPPALELAAGAEFPLEKTICSITLQTTGPLAIEAMGRSPHRTHPAYAAFQLESYVGVPVMVDGERLGTLNFSSAKEYPRAFTAVDLECLQLMAVWVASELSHERALADLTAANADLNMFARALSHDLRQPLQTVSSLVTLLREDHGATLDEQACTDIAHIADASARMEQILGGLTRLFQVTNLNLERSIVRLDSLVSSLARELERTDPERVVRWDIAEHIAVEGDEALLRTFVQNLLLNAWKFSAKREVTEIRFGVIERDGIRTFYLEDNGAGFDMCRAGQMFQPFHRLHRHDEYAGSGLGLATAQRIVQAHRGRIWAKGEVGVGATFYFTLGR